MTILPVKEWKLFLDDERYPGKDADENVVICRSSDEAIEQCKLRGCLPVEIMFDHDLGGDDTSMRFIRWLVDVLCDNADVRYKFPSGFTYSVHSQNPIGSANIKAYMDNIVLEFS